MDHEMSLQNMEPDDSIKVDQLHQLRHQENKDLKTTPNNLGDAPSLKQIIFLKLHTSIADCRQGRNQEGDWKRLARWKTLTKTNFGSLAKILEATGHSTTIRSQSVDQLAK
jgi:hypothetical protein